MKRCCAILLVCYNLTTTAQEFPRTNIDLSRVTDDLVGFQDNDINYQDLYENYAQLFSNPININTASADELRLLNILTEKQITSLLDYRKSSELISVYELQSVPDFDLNTIYKIIPFVVISNPDQKLNGNFIKRITNSQNSYLVTRFDQGKEKSKGYTSENPDTKFKGSPDRAYIRFRSTRANDFSFGVTSEKDAGEKIFWSPGKNQYGMDYLSAHAQIIHKKKIKNLIIGDYQCQFGQGLILGNAFGLGKGGETINTVRKSNLGFMPYTSVNEAGYMRGAAGTYALTKHLFYSGFYSNTKRDATVSDSEFPSFSSLSVTGLHRNERELNQRKRIAESIYGSVLNYKAGTMDAGIIFQHIEFGIPVIKDPSAYNQFAFQGNKNTNGSVFLNYTYQNFNFFSEAGKSINGGSGIVAGTLTSLHPNLDIALLYRKYDANFYTFYANSFSENTIAQNESGMYWGWKYRINKKYTTSAYVDLFSFPWLKFRTYKPSYGNEFLFRFNYQPSRKILMFAQLRQETKEKNISTDSKNYLTSKAVKRNFWLNFDYTLAQDLRLKTRAQFSSYSFNNKTTNGMALIQDITFSKGRFQISARYALFDTDDFDNRQYVYENDVWLAYSLPAYFGTGVRNYVLIEYKLSRHISLWARYSRMRYTDRSQTGSGQDLIDGNTTNDIKIQVRLTL
jgi:hypothetical protein